MMRSAAITCALVLAGCASGRSGSEVDANPGGGDTGPVQPDAALCGTGDLLPCEAIHVSKGGSDGAAGTKQAPVRTIAVAIAKAGQSNPLKVVFVQAGTYSESITMSPGVSLYGGFDETWEQNAQVVTEIVGDAPAVTFEAITVPTVLDHVTVRANDATAAGASSFAIAINGSAMVELVDVAIEAGIGAAGTDGGNGQNGGNGSAGAVGRPGVERSGALFCDSNPIPAGGAGGASSCGRNGGTGGTPGVAEGGGNAGAPGAGGTSGGPGAPGESSNGSTGGIGANGTSGSNGSGGASVGTFEGTRYVPSNGSDGTAGGNANGGGGGGGGGGGTVDCDSTGSSGGGGGGGGCGAGGATAGTGGGGSFGIVIVDSAVVIRSSTVTASRGGAGGRGGNGGTGGTGGAGGPGGPYGGSAEQDDGGFGAAGGRGGNGGNGGNGGGGGGGPSAAIVCVGTATVTIPQTTLTAGTPGAGGSSQGNAGSVGTTTNAIGCSFF